MCKRSVNFSLSTLLLIAVDSIRRIPQSHSYLRLDCRRRRHRPGMALAAVTWLCWSIPEVEIASPDKWHGTVLPTSLWTIVQGKNGYLIPTFNISQGDRKLISCDDRTFPAAPGTICRATSRPHHLCLFSEAVWRRTSSGVLFRNFFQCLQSDFCHYWHCNRFFTYLLTFNSKLELYFINCFFPRNKKANFAPLTSSFVDFRDAFWTPLKRATDWQWICNVSSNSGNPNGHQSLYWLKFVT